MQVLEQLYATTCTITLVNAEIFENKKKPAEFRMETLTRVPWIQLQHDL